MPSVTLSAVRDKQRPVQSLWGRLFLDPIAARVTLFVSNRSNVGPAWLTLLSLAIALTCAGLFWHPHHVTTLVAALLFPFAVVCERAAGLVALVRPGSGSPRALIAGQSLAPWTSVVCVLALASQTFAKTGDSATLVWMCLFVATVFMDATLLRIVIKARGALRNLYEARMASLDLALLRLKDRFETKGMKAVFFGRNEAALLALSVGPVTGFVVEAMAVAVVLGTVIFFFRLTLDLAMLKDEVRHSNLHYVADAEAYPPKKQVAATQP
tara:strand:- start:59 stop:865 length:807 start_codon:yes stop_codon:yes gene_type:complete